MCKPCILCPLCSNPSFNSVETLRTTLIKIINSPLSCPICKEILMGLDKLTLHLIRHDIKIELKNSNLLLENFVKIERKSHENLINNKNYAHASSQCEFAEENNKRINYENYLKTKKNENNTPTNNQEGELKFQKQTNTHDSYIISDSLAAPPILPQIYSLSHNVLMNSNNSKNSPNSMDNTTKFLSTNENNVHHHNTPFTNENKQIFPINNSNESSVTLLNNIFPPTSICNNFANNKTLQNELVLKNLVADNLSPIIICKPKCDICGLTFGSFDVLQKHIMVMHQTNETNVYLKSNSDIGKHEMRINFEKANINNFNSNNNNNIILYPCHLCSKSYKIKARLRLHLKVKHLWGISQEITSDGSKKFNICEKLRITNKMDNESNANSVSNKQSELFLSTLISTAPRKNDISNTSTSIDNNSEINLNEIDTNSLSPKCGIVNENAKIWKCDDCGKFYTTKYFLKKHKRMHTGETPYTCQICNKSFVFQQSYHKHLLYHSDDKPHICKTCGRAFKELSTLHNHERIHSGEKPFECKICGKRFRQRVSNYVHQRTHTGAKPYNCELCNKDFRYKVTLRTHKCIAGGSGQGTDEELIDDNLPYLLQIAATLPPDGRKFLTANENNNNNNNLLLNDKQISDNLEDDANKFDIDQIAIDYCNKHGITSSPTNNLQNLQNLRLDDSLKNLLYNFFDALLTHIPDATGKPIESQAASRASSADNLHSQFSDESDDGGDDDIESDRTYRGPHIKFPLEKKVIHTLIDLFRKKKYNRLHAKYVAGILREATNKLKRLPNLNQASTAISKQVTICGDLHGKLDDLLVVFHKNGLPSAENPYIFNGDFVDRGRKGLEVFLLLLACLCVFPGGVYLNRGNHEDSVMNGRYGFIREVLDKYRHNADRLLKLIDEVYRWLPLGTIVNNRVLIVHGGISDTTDLDLIKSLDRGKYVSILRPPITDSGQPGADIVDKVEWKQIFDIMWSDPKTGNGCEPNSLRGAGTYFGPDVTDNFLNKYKLSFLVRSHECKPDGHELIHDGKVITIFSASNYYAIGSNKGAYLKLNPQLDTHFVQYTAAASKTRKLTFRQKVGLIESSALRELGARLRESRPELEKEFKKYDIDSKGVITLSNWCEAMESATHLGLPWRLLRDKLAPTPENDTSSTSEVNYLRTLELLDSDTIIAAQMGSTSVAESLYRNKSSLEAIFRILDKDNSGYISLEEFGEACDLLQKFLPGTSTKEQLLEMCKMMDINKDGLVDLNEFLEAFRLCQAAARSLSSVSDVSTHQNGAIKTGNNSDNSTKNIKKHDSEEDDDDPEDSEAKQVESPLPQKKRPSTAKVSPRNSNKLAE